MSYTGTVKNGVVVLEAGVKLPEGTNVRVETLSKPSKNESASDPAFTIADLAVDCGIPDLSVNLDHYLYGHPKVTDGE